jgi:hypothetical protein
VITTVLATLLAVRPALLLVAATPAPAPAPPPAVAPAPAEKPARPADAILADAVTATGGQAAWNAHKSLHAKLELTFEGMGISGVGERFSTSADKSLTVTDLPGIGAVREGGNGKVFWAQDPVNGLRLLEGAEAEQARVESAWNPEQRLKEFYTKVESRTEGGPGGKRLECVVMTPKAGSPVTNCYDPVTHLQVLQKGTRATPQGDTPFVSTLRDWREVGGVKISFGVDTQAGPITFTARMTDVKFDEALDDKMFDPPSPASTAPAAHGGKGGEKSKGKSKDKSKPSPPKP